MNEHGHNNLEGLVHLNERVRLYVLFMLCVSSKDPADPIT